MSRLFRALAVLAGLCAPAHADTVYFTSFGVGGLYRYDTSNPAGTLSTLKTGLASPAAITMGPDGNLYIGEDGDAATIAPRITRFDPRTGTSSLVWEFAAFDVFPASVAFKGTDLLVGRNPFYGSVGPVVKIAGVIGGTKVVSDYTTGGSLRSSPGLALSPDGTLYVSDQSYNFVSGVASGPVKEFDASGAYVGEVIADGADGLFGPTGLAIDGRTLYTASIMAGTVLRTDLDTGVTSPFASAGGPFEVASISLLADGGLVATSPSGNGNIYTFGPDGALQSTFSTGFGQLGGIVAVPEPATILPCMMGLVGGILWARRSRNRSDGR